MAHVWAGWMDWMRAWLAGARGQLPGQVQLNHFVVVRPRQAINRNTLAAARDAAAAGARAAAAGAPAAASANRMREEAAAGSLASPSPRPPKAAKRPNADLAARLGAVKRAAKQAVQRNRGKLAGAASVLFSSSINNN